MKRIVLALLILNGCASMTHGTDQSVFVSTDPAGAYCRYDKNGEQVGAIEKTPGFVIVTRTKDDIVINCKKGNLHGLYIDHSGADYKQGTWSAVMTGGVGLIIDSATGSDNQYDDHVFIVLK